VLLPHFSLFSLFSTFLFSISLKCLLSPLPYLPHNQDKSPAIVAILHLFYGQVAAAAHLLILLLLFFLFFLQAQKYINIFKRK